MSKRMCRFSMFVILILMAFVAMTACSLPTPPTEVRAPYCALTGDLVRPLVEFPIDFEIVDDLTPAFSWGYYYADCRPRNYHIEVSNLGTTGDCGSRDWDGDGYLVISETIGAGTEWSPATALEPLTLHHWRVAGVLHDTMGDYSDVGCFYTGPACASASLVAPELVSPDDAAIIDLEYVVLVWSYPEGCLPENYLAELSADPSFAGPNMMDDSGVMETQPLTRQASMPLEDCTEYYWRVTARVGTTWGPTSETRTFTTDFGGTCSDTSKSSACNFDCDCESEQGENEYNCPKDCPKHCGNGTCDCGETSANCKKDCGPEKLDCVCGNGVCQAECGETPNTCLSDCP